MRLYEFLTICNNDTTLIEFLIAKGIFVNEINCPTCGSKLKLTRNLATLQYHCHAVYYKQIRNKKRRRMWCNFKVSALTGTWFAHSRLSVATACRFISYFLTIRPSRQHFLEQEFGISSRTAVDWTNFCRELCVLWANHISEPIGGPNIIVEIDECKIGKRKYHKGRIITGQWIFGGIERNSHRTFIVPVENRSAKTLLNIIKKWIKPGTIIISDCWRAYNCLEDEDYQHATVNHKYNFVNPETGAHTQNIERIWREVRDNIPRYGRRKYHYVSYFAEYLFKRKHSFLERIDAFFAIMAELYPPTFNE